MSATHDQRLPSFSDVLGALLIFGSWFASNALAQQAQSETDKHQAIIERIRNFRLYEDFAGRTRDIQVELARMSDSSPAIPRWTGMTPPQIRQLNDLVGDLEGYAAGAEDAPTSPNPMATVRESVDRLSEEFGAAREEHERIVTAIEAQGAGVSRDAATESDLQRRIDTLWEEYGAAKKAMLLVGDERLESAAVQAASASHAAIRSKRISYVLYALGSLLFLYGRVRNPDTANKMNA